MRGERSQITTANAKLNPSQLLHRRLCIAGRRLEWYGLRAPDGIGPDATSLPCPFHPLSGLRRRLLREHSREKDVLLKTHHPGSSWQGEHGPAPTRNRATSCPAATCPSSSRLQSQKKNASNRQECRSHMLLTHPPSKPLTQRIGHWPLHVNRHAGRHAGAVGAR